MSARQIRAVLVSLDLPQTVAMAKALTRDQTERKKSKAARFMERIGQPDRADEFDQMSVDDYAEGKGRRLANPATRERNRTMANGATTTTKADLQDQIDSAISTLEDAYQPSPPAKN